MLHSIHPETKGCVRSSRHASEVFLRDAHRAFDAHCHGVVVGWRWADDSAELLGPADQLLVLAELVVAADGGWNNA
eukprot:3089619-Rhodomonas_salina.1